MTTLPLKTGAIVAVLCLAACRLPAAEQNPTWTKVTLPAPRSVQFSGSLGNSLDRGVKRLALPPFTEQWLRADVSFEIERIFTNYSGDASGRFLELASLTTPTDNLTPPTLAPHLKTVPQHQKPDGHFGANVDLTKPLTKGSPAGPVATSGSVQEWPFCCSFHGPLGLHFLKQYLAVGSDRGVYVNFPLDFSATVRAMGRDWNVHVQNTPKFRDGNGAMTIELAPKSQSDPVRTTLFVRMPQWARNATVTSSAGDDIAATTESGYLRIARPFRAAQKLTVTFETGLSLEARRFKTLHVEPARISRLRDVTVFSGPQVLLAARVPGSGQPVLLAQVTDSGSIDLPRAGSDAYATVLLSSLDATDADIAKALDSARPILLRPWTAITTRARSAFAADLLVLPANSPALKSLPQFAKRAAELNDQAVKPFFGEHLERRPDIWLANPGWEFTPDALHVSAGDIALIDGLGYTDYRFEFDLVLPNEGQGIAGWVVRASSEADCVMFQLQSADSPYNAPEFKTKPNTLRPHIRRNSQWTIADPIALPKEIRRGQSHHIAVECNADRIEVFLDGQKIHTMTAADHNAGPVGFRAAGPAEQGLFSHISLRKL